MINKKVLENKKYSTHHPEKTTSRYYKIHCGIRIFLLPHFHKQTIFTTFAIRKK